MLHSAQQSYFDLASLSSLKTKAKGDARAALKEVASEFEGIFLKMMLKSMRSASFGDPLFDSESAKIYRDMYDDQLSVELSRSGGVGLADMIVKQMEHYLPTPDEPVERIIHNPAPVQQSAPLKKPEVKSNIAESPKSFVEALWPVAKQTANELGVSPKVLLAQAALETGWGKYVIKDPAGNSSFNLFNIKADHRWSGDNVKIASLEYIAGKPKSQTSHFRAYQSYQESFSDYAQFLKQSSRYQKALAVAHDDKKYVSELQAAGYATDPNYAKKIIRIINDKPLNNALDDLLRSGKIEISASSQFSSGITGDHYAIR